MKIGQYLAELYQLKQRGPIIMNHRIEPFYSPWAVSGTTRVSWYQKVKTNLDLLEQLIVSGSGISWAYGNLHLTQIDNHTSIPPLFLYRQVAFPATQPSQSTEGKWGAIKQVVMSISWNKCYKYQ